MKDLAMWMLQWSFSAAGLIHLIGALLLALAAEHFSRSRSVAKFLVFALALWFTGALLSVLQPMRFRAFLAGAVWLLSIAVVYAGVLSILVAKGKGRRPIAATTVALVVLQVPLSWLSAIYFACYVGHDCP
jgi:hypothetical protein